MRQTTRHLPITLLVGGVILLTLAAPAMRSTGASPGQSQDPAMLTPMASVTPRAAQLSRFLPLLLDSYMFPGPPQPPFGQEPHAVIGDPRAPIVIVQFADFQCPFCQRHHAQTEPQIYDQYIRTGLVRYVVKDFPLSSIHPQAQKASEAAECAGQQDGYWTMHDKLYDELGQWSGNSGAVALFEQYARNQGLDGDAFDTCLETGAFYGEVQGDFQEGITAGINGVPWFFLYGPTFNTQIIGAQPFSVFQAAIDNLLNGSAYLPGAYPYSSFQQIIDSLLDGEMAIATTPPQQERGLCLNLP